MRAGRSREAVLAFGRVLLRDPLDPEARHGLDFARSAVAESRRDLEARLEQARVAFDGGQHERSRALLEEIVAAGAERDAALELFDRLDRREGRITARSAARAGLVAPALPVAAGRPVWSRRALVAVWSLTFASLAAGVASSWDRIVGGLVEPPVPSPRPAAPPVTEIAAPTPGERVLARANRLLEQGDSAGAAAVLERVLPDDPAYPFALRLRLDAQAALRSGPRQ